MSSGDSKMSSVSSINQPSSVPAGQITTTTTSSSSSRKNAWGNMSYADLITQAIRSSPESRLTLSQIYDWMVTNVPYFKDKGDSNSSAGWKNSIRHNLSLHNKFMRVQNEGTGKSSWWILNPDVGNSPNSPNSHQQNQQQSGAQSTANGQRRRANSMDTNFINNKKIGKRKQANESVKIKKENSIKNICKQESIQIPSGNGHGHGGHHGHLMTGLNNNNKMDSFISNSFSNHSDILFEDSNLILENLMQFENCNHPSLDEKLFSSSNAASPSTATIPRELEDFLLNGGSTGGVVGEMDFNTLFGGQQQGTQGQHQDFQNLPITIQNHQQGQMQHQQNQQNQQQNPFTSSSNSNSTLSLSPLPSSLLGGGLLLQHHQQQQQSNDVDDYSSSLRPRAYSSNSTLLPPHHYNHLKQRKLQQLSNNNSTSVTTTAPTTLTPPPHFPSSAISQHQNIPQHMHQQQQVMMASSLDNLLHSRSRINNNNNNHNHQFLLHCDSNSLDFPLLPPVGGSDGINEGGFSPSTAATIGIGMMEIDSNSNGPIMNDSTPPPSMPSQQLELNDLKLFDESLVDQSSFAVENFINNYDILAANNSFQQQQQQQQQQGNNTGNSSGGGDNVMDQSQHQQMEDQLNAAQQQQFEEQDQLVEDVDAGSNFFNYFNNNNSFFSPAAAVDGRGRSQTFSGGFNSWLNNNENN